MYKHVLHIVLFGGERFVAKSALIRLFLSLPAACAMSSLRLLVLDLGRIRWHSSLGHRHKLGLLTSQGLGQAEEKRLGSSASRLRCEEGRKVGIARRADDLGVAGQSERHPQVAGEGFCLA